MLSHVWLSATPETLPVSSVHGIIPARVLEKVPVSPPGDPLNPGVGPVSPAAPALSGEFFLTEPPGRPTNTLLKPYLQHFLLLKTLYLAIKKLQSTPKDIKHNFKRQQASEPDLAGMLEWSY